MVEKVIGFETEAYVGVDPAAVTATVKIGGVVSISSPEWSRDTVDVTDSDSASRTREFIPGLADAGELTIEVHFDPNHATETEVIEMMGEKTARLWEVRWPQFATKQKCSFRALLTGKAPAAPLDDKAVQSLKFKVTGPMTWASYI